MQTTTKKVFFGRTAQIIVLLILGLVTVCGWGQTKDKAKLDNLLVYGDGFMFSVKEPKDWKGDIEIAEKYYANIVFYKSNEDIKKGSALIQIYSFGKKDEATENDLQYDIDGYKKDYKNLKQKDFVVSHKEYRCFSKLVYVEKDFYQYIVYINPGTKYKRGLSVCMNIRQRQATDNELKAFKEIVDSLIMLKG